MLSSGFYNSKGGDRKYDAEQFGAMFNGLITDGVFAHYKDALKVTAGSGNRELVVKPGRAWFNGTWTEVDDNGHSIYLMGSAVEATYFVYLAVNKMDRKNTIAWYSNMVNNDPEKGTYFYLLAQVTIPGGATKISETMITDTRGSDLCPYVTGIMETVSFEEIVKRVCGDSWQDWLGVYEAGITTGVQNAVRASSEALSEVKSLKAYSVESEAVSYTWAKFEAIATGGGGFEWATDSVHTELVDTPMPMCLFRDLSYTDLGAGFKPSISLGSPYKPDGETTLKPVPASTQAKVWKEYPYFWEGGGAYGTEVLRYDDLQRVIVTSAGVATEKYRYRISRLVHLPVTYEPGAYMGTVTADNATAYPRDGYKDGYWYKRFAAKAEDVSFYYPGLSAKNVQDAIIEVARTGGTGGGSAMSVIEVEELPATGIPGVMYVVKKSGDSDAVEYLWLDRWEKIGGKVPIVKVAEQPTFVNDVSECTDTSKVYVLPNGHLAAYMTKEVTTEGSTVPNFTNIYNKENGAYIKDRYRYSHSSGVFSAEAETCAVVVPVPGGSWKTNQPYTLRVQGATINGGTTRYKKIYTGTTSDAFPNSGAEPTATTEPDGTVVFVHTQNAADNITTFSWLVFHVDNGVDENNLIVTFNEEISYTTTEGGTEIVSAWTDTGIEYNQPPDYADRVAAVEKKTAQLVSDVDVLKNKVCNLGGGLSGSSGGMDAFAYAAYPPSPQLPGDGSDEADFNTSDVATSEVYAYMDALWTRFRTYMVKQNLGKDSSGEYDYYRYVFSKAYWRAWYKENYPKMFAWINGSTVIYSESVSPRVGDTLYTTPYIGTAYSTVTAVNSETVGTASTRTVNGLVFERYSAGDVEPTIVYTTPFAITANYKGRTYTDAFAPSSSVKEFTHEYIVDNTDAKYYRYPFEDRKLDKSRLFSVFILSNEHGNHGDSMIPCVTVLRMLKDLCGNTGNLFLKWLKENAIVTVIPLGNPYGGYNNANGVNINRNYDTPGWAGSDNDPAGGTKEEGAFGAYAGDQIETQYIMNTIQQCKAQTAVSYHGRGIPTGTLLGEYNSHGRFQGCGFDPERMWKVEEALFSMYNFGFSPDWHTIDDDSLNNYLNAGKSPSYIEYAGAVGGLIEIDDYEVGTLDRFTPLAMEQAYAEVLLVLQNWVKEALLKASS